MYTILYSMVHLTNLTFTHHTKSIINYEEINPIYTERLLIIMYTKYYYVCCCVASVIAIDFAHSIAVLTLTSIPSRIRDRCLIVTYCRRFPTTI